MPQREKDLATFQTRVRQMILQQLKARLAEQERNYETLKMARMMEISDGDLEGAKERVAGLIRSINKCITLLSEEK